MTAQTGTASLAPGFMPEATARTSTRRLVVVTASFLLQAVIVLGFVSSSLGLGVAPYPDADHGWASPSPSVVPVAPAVEAIPTMSGAGPQPAPAPAP